MTFTWTWAHIPFIILGIALIFAPVIGTWWARDWRPRRCPRCNRELIGSPPQHLRADRAYCQHLAVVRGETL